MAAHLSLDNTPLVNLNLVARGITMTQEYAAIHEEMTRQEFPAKINTLTMTSLFMGVISGLIGLMVHKKAGTVLLCSVALPLIGVFYLNQRRDVYLSKLEDPLNGILSVFQQMTKYLNEERQFKESVLVREFSAQKSQVTRYDDDAKATLFVIESNFNTQKLKLADAAETQRCVNHGKIRDVASWILRMNRPAMFYQSWEDLSLSCYQLLHGRHNQRLLSQNNPYVSLEYKRGSWVAS